MLNVIPMKQSESQKRHLTRQLIIQGLYQWYYNPIDIAVLERQLSKGQEQAIDSIYFAEILRNILRQLDVLDELYLPYLDRPLHDLDPIAKAICRLATYELWQRPDVPYRVVINEALELAKLFGPDKSHAFVNGVLEHLLQKLRPNEYQAR